MIRHLAFAGVAFFALVDLSYAKPQAAEPKPPEALLAKDCLAYIRFDGIEPHRAAFEKTALAEVLNRDLGQFVAHLGELIQDETGPGTVKTKLLAGLPPEQLLQFHQASARLPQLISYLKQHGFVMGLEYVSMLPPQGQLTIIFPNGGQTNHKEAIYAGCQLLAALNDLKISVSKQANREVNEAKISEMLQWRWWQEGAHVVMTVGNATVDHTVSVLEGKRPNLTAHPLLKSTENAVAYETMVRGFIDVERAMAFTKLLPKEADKTFDELGLKGLKTVTFHLGGIGRQTRSSLVITTVGERKGLLKLLSGAPEFSLEPLPPLPPDSSSVLALHLDFGELYALIRKLEDTAMTTAAAPAPPGEFKPPERPLTRLNYALGLDVEKDLLPALGSKIVIYNSGGEGIFGTGFGLAIQVKDEAKLKESLTTITRSLPSAVESNVQLTSRKYLDAEIHVAQMSGRGPSLAVSPSYTVHNGWLVVGLFPQTVQGYLLRTQGKVATWKPSPHVKEVLAEVKKNPQARIMLVSEADPRTPVKDLAGFGPFFAAQLGAFGQTPLDPTLIPNFQTVTENLFPNVGLIVDDGTAIRLETYQSLGIPFDPVGIQTYWLAGLIFGQLGF